MVVKIAKKFRIQTDKSQQDQLLQLERRSKDLKTNLRFLSDFKADLNQNWGEVKKVTSIAQRVYLKNKF